MLWQTMLTNPIKADFVISVHFVITRLPKHTKHIHKAFLHASFCFFGEVTFQKDLHIRWNFIKRLNHGRTSMDFVNEVLYNKLEEKQTKKSIVN
jgi:hypothetical protein